MEIYYIDGQYVPSDQAFIPVNDLALLRGYGVFEFLRTHNGAPFLLTEHLIRLQESAHKIGLRFPWALDQMRSIVMNTLRKNNLQDATIRIVVTGGPSRDFITPEGAPRLIVIISPATALPESWYTNGIKVIVTPMERTVPGAKSINYLDATIALKKAREQGAAEAVYMDSSGCVKEGTTSNLFAFYGNRLITPGQNILSGITRQAILKIAEPLFAVDIREIPVEKLLAADEVFISGSNKGIVPVVRIDEAMVGNGTPGQNTRTLMQRFADYILQSTVQPTGNDSSNK
jgi:branched-chain amino acid aminotransferase